jgi:hypothetical protein
MIPASRRVAKAQAKIGQEGRLWPNDESVERPLQTVGATFSFPDEGKLRK